MDRQVGTLLLTKIVGRIKPVFPDDTAFVECRYDEGISSDSICYKIDWYLKDDLIREHKKSKKILLTLSREFGQVLFLL
jgi:hypothetical protein